MIRHTRSSTSRHPALSRALWFALALALLPGFLVFLSISPQSTEAATLPKGLHHTTSRYVYTASTGIHYNWGCADGQAGMQGAAVLLYGQPIYQSGSYGAFHYGNQFISTSGIIAAVEAYIDGYWNCGSTNQVRILVGTTNYSPQTDMYSHGYAWADMVNTIANYIFGTGRSGNIAVAGTNDIENDISSGWSTGASAIAWGNGWNSRSPSVGFHYLGDCAGCPTSYQGNVTLNSGWTVEQYYQAMTFDAGGTYAVPQNYNTLQNQALEYAAISEYGQQAHGHGVAFYGALTQFVACKQFPAQCSQVDNFPLFGFATLYDTVQRNSYVSGLQASMQAASDIFWTGSGIYQYLSATPTGAGNAGGPTGPWDQTQPLPEVIDVAYPGSGWLFTGWRYDGQKMGWANGVTIRMNGGHAMEATFGQAQSFNDVPPGNAAYNAVGALAARNIIAGYGDGNFGVNDYVQRAQMAAFLDRGIPSAYSGTCLAQYSWDCESWSDSNFQDIGGLAASLQRNIRTIAHYGVTYGCTSTTFCPTATVTQGEVIAFISRAMVNRGYWVMQPDNPSIYPGISQFRQEVVTYYAYTNGTGIAWNTGSTSPATRGWVAIHWWKALDSYFGTDRVP